MEYSSPNKINKNYQNKEINNTYCPYKYVTII